VKPIRSWGRSNIDRPLLGFLAVAPWETIDLAGVSPWSMNIGWSRVIHVTLVSSLTSSMWNKRLLDLKHGGIRPYLHPKKTNTLKSPAQVFISASSSVSVSSALSSLFKSNLDAVLQPAKLQVFLRLRIPPKHWVAYQHFPMNWMILGSLIQNHNL
jgi:hypothetical protein